MGRGASACGSAEAAVPACCMGLFVGPVAAAAGRPADGAALLACLRARPAPCASRRTRHAHAPTSSPGQAPALSRSRSSCGEGGGWGTAGAGGALRRTPRGNPTGRRPCRRRLAARRDPAAGAGAVLWQPGTAGWHGLAHHGMPPTPHPPHPAGGCRAAARAAHCSATCVCPAACLLMRVHSPWCWPRLPAPRPAWWWAYIACISGPPLQLSRPKAWAVGGIVWLQKI